MADYADWTDSIELLGSVIMVPMDFQGATIMVPLDLQGSTIQMPVDIQGQTVDVKIDINAQTIGNLSVDVTAQTIGNLTISVAAQSVGVYLQPEWAAKTGVDKNLFAFANNQAIGGSAYTTYTVPSGKTFYLCGVGSALVAYAVADYDHHLYARLSIVDVTTATVLARFGGLGGAAISLNKPMAIAAGHEFRVYCYNHANVNCNIDVSAWGYEV